MLHGVFVTDPKRSFDLLWLNSVMTWGKKLDSNHCEALDAILPGSHVSAFMQELLPGCATHTMYYGVFQWNPCYLDQTGIYPCWMI